MAIWLRVISGLISVALLLLVLDAAIRTFLLPRVASVRLSRVVAKAVGWIFRLIAKSRGSYRGKDQILSLYPSIILLTFQTLWRVLSLFAFALGFVAAGVATFAQGFETSGSSLFTLGTTSGHGAGEVTLGFVEAGVGLTLLALLISFIPTLYAAFQRREISVSRLSVRSGSPSTP